MNLLEPIKNNIPNAITCLNLLSGCLACICASHGSEHIGGDPVAITYYQLAFIMIAAAAVFDFFDGFVARLLGAVSSIGKELDSLSDCVSFGLAPALILYFMLRELYPSSWVAYSALLVAVFGAVRLARFNTDDSQATSFVGLPIPANAIFWIGFCDYFYAIEPAGEAGLWVAFAAVVLLSYAMVSRLRMFSLKFKSYGLRGNVHRYLLVAGTVAAIVLLGVKGLAVSIIFYFVLALLFLRQEKDAVSHR